MAFRIYVILSSNLSAILAEKQSLINRNPDFTMEEDSILIGNENSFISPEKEEAYRQFLEKLFQTARAPQMGSV